jgi:hypothetical protein
MSSYRIKIPQLERATQAIGYVCVFWAWLEDHIGEMILDLAPFDKAKITDREIKQLRDVIFVDSDIRSKIKILRAVAFIRKFDADTTWFAQMDKLLNKIDNELRPQRNRIIHGQWFAPKPRRLERRSKHAKLKRPQSFAKMELSTEERVPVKMREIWSLSRSLIAAQFKLAQLGIRHDEIQKVIDKGVRELKFDDDLKLMIQAVHEDAASGGPFLQSLLARFLKQHPRQASDDTRPTTPPAKRRPRQRSSRKKPLP